MTTNEALDRKLDRVIAVTESGFKTVQTGLSDQDKRLATLEANTRTTEAQLDRVLHLVDGNGLPPLAARMADLETGLENLEEKFDRALDKAEERQKRLADRVWDIAKPLIIAAVGAAIGAASAVSAFS